MHKQATTPCHPGSCLGSRTTMIRTQHKPEITNPQALSSSIKKLATIRGSKLAQHGVVMDKLGILLEQFGVTLDNNGVITDKLGNKNTPQNRILTANNSD